LRFDLTDLRLFLNIAEAGSITAGAERSHIALASASARVRGMEHALGAALLTRRKRGVEPTEAGRALLHHARAVLDQMERMRADLGEYARGFKGRVRLLSNTAALTEFLPQALSGYLADHPGVDIELEEHPSTDIVNAVAAGYADVGIVADSADTARLETFAFRPDRLMLIVPRQHPLAARRSISFCESLDHDYVGLAEGSALQAHLEAHAARAGRRLRYRVRLATFDAVCEMVACGVGVAVVPATALERAHCRALLERVSLDDRWALRELRICVRSAAALQPHASELVRRIAA
jgi:DNA-binding transcriptional LysR family regulator